MPKSKNRRKKGNHKRKGPTGPYPSMESVRMLARKLDTPEMRELYERQKVLNPNLDADLDKMPDEIEEIINHVFDSKGKEE